MNGYQLFSHRIHVYWNDDFLRIRHWLFETYGLGCELELFQINQQLELGYTWAWQTKDHRLELYLNQEQLGGFLMFTT